MDGGDMVQKEYHLKLSHEYFQFKYLVQLNSSNSQILWIWLSEKAVIYLIQRAMLQTQIIKFPIL